VIARFFFLRLTRRQLRGVRSGGGGHAGLGPPMAACWSTINNIIVSGEVILSDENCGKPLGSRGSAPNPAGGAHGAPPDPLADGEGLLPPLPPLSVFSPSVLAPMKNWARRCASLTWHWQNWHKHSTRSFNSSTALSYLTSLDSRHYLCFPPLSSRRGASKRYARVRC